MTTQKVIYRAKFTRGGQIIAHLFVAGHREAIKKFKKNEVTSTINEIVDYIETERKAEVLSFSFSSDNSLFILAKVFS